MKICHTCHETYSNDVEFCPRDGARLATQATETEAQLAAGLARRYRIVRRLGTGGMGTVFLVEQIGVGNRPVALKVLNRKLLDDPDFLLRFHNEAGSTGRIHHANVVTIYESAQADDGTPYIAMEFLEGESLREVLKRRGALPVPEVAEILQQAARGLNAAHKLGIIHRDIKPDNIFLTYPDDDAGATLVADHDVGAGLVPALPVGSADTGRAHGPPLRPVVVKVVDFGIAKLRESATHTQTGMVLGTPAYMSYEQASGMRSDELDARSDVYSLGVVVYEMLTGRAPFHSDTPVGYLRKHLMEEPPPFRAVAPGLGVPPEVESAVMKALTKDRDQRYASVLVFARDFARAATLPSPAEPPKPYATTKRVEPAMPQSEVGAVRGQTGTGRDLSGSDREPPLREPSSALPPSETPAAPVARPPDVGASGARPEAERRSALQLPGPSARPSPPVPPAPSVPRQTDVGAVPDRIGTGREPPLREPGSTLPPSETPAAPVARPPDVGASGARPEAERRSALQLPGPSARPSPPVPPAPSVPRQTDVGAVPDRIGTGREPPLRVNGARPQPQKTSRAGIASLLAAVVVVIMVALVWVYWRGPTTTPTTQPGVPQQGTSVPAKPETPIPTPSVNNPPTNPPSPQVSPAQIVVETSANAQVYLDDTFKGQVGRKGRLVIEDPKPGDHALRVSLAGKKDYEHRVTVAAGQVVTITATLADAEQPSPPAPVETPRRTISAPAARTVRDNPEDGLKYVWIPPGTFMMGCSPGDSECDADEKPAHQVTITKGFWIGQTPVTVGAYKRNVGATGRQMPPTPNFNNSWANENMPIVNVTWDEAQAYCGWMGGRLPTEAEWEYAARGGSTEARYGNLDEIAWYNQNSGNRTHDVAQKRPNGFGLYDMLGNVWEWVNDWYGENYYPASPERDPRGPDSGQLRVLRGGSWFVNPGIVRVSNRGWFNPANRDSTLGFRCGGEVAGP
jgi:serine/threonine-protein kinase